MLFNVLDDPEGDFTDTLLTSKYNKTHGYIVVYVTITLDNKTDLLHQKTKLLTHVLKTR